MMFINYILFFIAGAAPVSAAPLPQMAVFGDSLSTGAATNPALTFDPLDLWRVFSGETDLAVDKPPPQRLWPSPREFFGGADWLFRNMMQGLARHYLDTEQYSWGYQLAESLQIPAAALTLAGENGARVQDLTHHADRLLVETGNRLPPRVFLMYSGNDLCGAAAALTTSAEDYKTGLRQGLLHLTTAAEAPPGGTDIYVPGFLSVLQIVDGPTIMAKPVKAFGKETTCHDLRRSGFRATAEHYDPGLPPDAWYFAMVMPPNPSAYCPTLFGEPGVNGETAKQREDTVAALANRIRAYREGQRAVVDELNAAAVKAVQPAAPRVRYHYIAATEGVMFGADDIAGDCFHLSRAGQGKVAAAIFTAL